MSAARVWLCLWVWLCACVEIVSDHLGGYDGFHCFEAPPSPCLLCDATQLLVTVATTMFTL